MAQCGRHTGGRTDRTSVASVRARHLWKPTCSASHNPHHTLVYTVPAQWRSRYFGHFNRFCYLLSSHIKKAWIGQCVSRWKLAESACRRVSKCSEVHGRHENEAPCVNSTWLSVVRRDEWIAEHLHVSTPAACCCSWGGSWTWDANQSSSSSRARTHAADVRLSL